MSNALAVVKQRFSSPAVCRMIGEAAPRWMRHDDLHVQVAYAMMYSMDKNEKLAACTIESLEKVAIDSITLGLIPGGPLEHAHPVPFWNKKIGRFEASLIIGYKGFILLVERGKVVKVEAESAHENDHFMVSKGTSPLIEHRLDYRQPRGELFATYAVATLEGGHTQFEVVPLDELEAIAEKAKKKSKGFTPWTDHFRPMAVKTAVRRLCKLLPQSRELASALAYDAHIEMGTRPVLDADLAETAAQPPKDGAQELLARLEDVTPEAQALNATAVAVADNGKRQCPTCGLWFQRLGAHKCQQAPAHEDVAQDDDWEDAIAAAVQKHGRGAVDAVFDALGLPGMAVEWRGQEQILAATACDLLVDSVAAPAPEQMALFCDNVRARVEA